MRLGYLDVVRCVRQWGVKIAPREQPTIELSNFQLILTDPTKSVPWGIGRRLNLSIASAEFVQLVGGYSDLHQLTAITPRFADFADEGRLRGAYGPRLRSQFPNVLERLVTDHQTRQAVAVIWRPSDLAGSSRDVPCTVSLEWQIREGCLDMTTNMRSNDVWLGMAFDVPIFTALQRTIAHVLDVETGAYVHNVRSLHIYERDLEAASALYSPDLSAQADKVPPLEIGDELHPNLVRVKSRWHEVRTLARAIGLNTSDSSDIFAANAVHRDRLARYQPDRRLCRKCHYTYISASPYCCPTCDFM